MEEAVREVTATHVNGEPGSTKLLGAHVDLDLYWEFKRAAAANNDSIKEAIQHAAHMYIDVTNRKEELG